jgi:flagellar biosynthesis anti-sigma factor FlgM
MDKPHNQRPGGSLPPANNNGNGLKEPESLLPLSLPSPPSPPSAKGADATGNDELIEQVRQIIAEAPEIRPEKVGPLKEAVEQGTYEIDTRKLANALITKLILDP